VLNALRLHRGGIKAKVGSGCSTPCGFTEVGIFYLLPSNFYLSGCCFSPQSKIENPKSCVGPSAIRTGSRTRPSDWGWNAQFGPEENRRNNRRLATFTCTLCVLQIWWLSPFTLLGFTEVGIFCLLPSTFYLSGCCFSPQSKIENPKSCVGPSAIRTGSRTRPSDWGSNARFGPVEDRRNHRRLSTFTCTLCVLQI
jgi:hypothetical protein